MAQKKENKDCFVIMPLSDCDGYENGHFQRVYEDIIIPAVEKTDFIPKRADDVKETNFIHLDILQKLIDAPIVICDLSTRNPNVLFELGIRQAFDKPVVLIQEKGTPKIFDIAPLRYLEYSKDMKYHEVKQSQSDLTVMINATKEAEKDKGNVNSVVRLLALSSPAAIPHLEGNNKESLALDVFNSQMNEMRRMIEMLITDSRKNIYRRPYGNIIAVEYERISSKLDKLEKLLSINGTDPTQLLEEYHNLFRNAEEMLMTCDNEKDHRLIRMLIDRIRRQLETIQLL